MNRLPAPVLLEQLVAHDQVGVHLARQYGHDLVGDPLVVEAEMPLRLHEGGVDDGVLNDNGFGHGLFPARVMRIRFLLLPPKADAILPDLGHVV